MGISRKKQELLNKELEIKEKIQTERYKRFVRNLKICGHCLNFSMPFILSSGVMVGGSIVIFNEVPFVLEDTTKYKLVNLDADGEKIEAKEEYVTFYRLTDNDPSSTVVTLEKYEDGIKKTYTYSTSSFDKEMYDAILEKDYLTIENLSIEQSEETLKEMDNTNEIDSYKIFADIEGLDEEDFLSVPEAKSENNKNSRTVVGLSLAIGGLITCLRNYKLKKAISEEIEYYKTSSIKTLKLQLKNVKESQRALGVKK